LAEKSQPGTNEISICKHEQYKYTQSATVKGLIFSNQIFSNQTLIVHI